MANIIANSQKELNQVNELLDKKIPSYRQAYSDRTAWLMACLSELVYVKFNPLIACDNEPEIERLKMELKTLRLVLLKTFDSDGTQAMLVSNDRFIALAFRGTEADFRDPSGSLKDIKADMKAEITLCETGGNIHTGFRDAFDAVAQDIQNTLNEEELKEKPLFITGHSLGGALATVTAKKLAHKGGISACYTFGAPRVGNDEWIANIKTPIYRLVNAADCVTMLPPGDEWITFFAWIARGIAWCRITLISRWAESISRWLLSKFGGYFHGGNMRYMTNCENGKYEHVKLLYSVSFFRRVKGWWFKKGRGGKFLADHSISVYRKKLMVIAERRNRS